MSLQAHLFQRYFGQNWILINLIKIGQQEFLCAINGHVMKDPVRAQTSGLVFERATISLWLASRGSVCPITNNHLELSDLTPDDELRNR